MASLHAFFGRNALAFGLALACLSGLGTAQTSLTPIRLDASLPAVAGPGLHAGRVLYPSIFSLGNLSATAFVRREEADWAVYVSTSDGTGALWSQPVRIDSDSTGSQKRLREQSVWIAENTIYVVWEDERAGEIPPTTDLYLNVSKDGGATWEGELRIDKGYPAGGNPIRDWRMVVNNVLPGQHFMYLVLSVQGNSDRKEELLITGSVNMGASFIAPSAISSIGAGVADVDAIDVALQRNLKLAVVWQDDRTGTNEVYYQRSENGGVSWLANDVKVSSVAWQSDQELSVALRDETVVVAWLEEMTDRHLEQLWVNVSDNFGIDSWEGPQMVGNYDAMVDDVDQPIVELVGDRIVLAWCDDRDDTFANDGYVASRDISGGAWTESLISSSGSNFPRFARARPEDRADRLVWSSDDYPNTALASHSNDDGATWGAAGTFSMHPGTDVDYAYATWNAAQNRMLCVYLANPTGHDEIFVGGVQY